MTSSLVGSEMCIRDSVLTSNPPHIHIGINSDYSLFTTTVNTAPGPTPVSYTHLTLPTICSV
eukprot:5621429-Prorocentrum_lima.AAC.1